MERANPIHPVPTKFLHRCDILKPEICGKRLTIQIQSSKISRRYPAEDTPRRNQMIVPALRTILLAALLALPVAAANDGTRNSDSNDAPKNHNEWTVAHLQAAMASGKLTSEDLTKEYITRIVALDQSGPGVNSVIELNPDALELARQPANLPNRSMVR